MSTLINQSDPMLLRLEPGRFIPIELVENPDGSTCFRWGTPRWDKHAEAAVRQEQQELREYRRKTRSECRWGT